MCNSIYSTLLYWVYWKKEYSWIVEERPYKEEEILVQDQNVIVTYRTQQDKSKAVGFKWYLNIQEIKGFIICTTIGDKEKVKDNLINLAKIKFEFVIDDYFLQSMEDVELPSRCELDDFNNHLRDLLDQFPNDLKLIITFENGSITYDKWENDSYLIVNGNKSGKNIESKAYLANVLDK